MLPIYSKTHLKEIKENIYKIKERAEKRYF